MVGRRKRGKRLPKSLRKYIRQEKARIRREFFFDLEEQKRQIEELYRKITKRKGDFVPKLK